ncbi:hypothetical protein [Pararhizobium haloflavum]|uniref:hypothetical protein n=1 Tax=Pararhizobium haloflavum TaxID=2037914 RepID=UPI0012FFECF9|nr:hypothetical protein [Pararhizobium haloflavum]
MRVFRRLEDIEHLIGFFRTDGDVSAPSEIAALTRERAALADEARAMVGNDNGVRP